MRQIRICCVADMHGRLPAIPPCDLLLFLGDNAPDFASPWHPSSQIRQLTWYNTKFADYLHTVQSRTGCAVFAIAGNHDFALFRHAKLLDDAIPWTYLQDDGAEWEGLKLWGSPWVPNCRGWAFVLPDEKMENRMSRIPEGIDILLLHGPPYGYGDRVMHADRIEHAGSGATAHAVWRVKPKLVAFGHIHEDPGVWKQDGMTLINASVLNDRYEVARPPTMFLLDAPEGQG